MSDNKSRNPWSPSGQPSVENGHSPRAEPRVQHIRILLQILRSARRALGRLLPRHRHVLRFCAVPRRNPVSPPQLPRQRPVANIAHPVEIFFATIVRNDANFPALHRRNRRLRQRLHLAKPLRRSPRLHNRAAAFAQSHRVRVVGQLFPASPAPSNPRQFSCAPRSGPCPAYAPAAALILPAVGHHINFCQLVPSSQLQNRWDRARE